MRHDRQSQGSRRRLPRALGATVLATLTAGALVAGLPAGAALASGGPAVQSSLVISTSVKALGHIWSLSVSDDGGEVDVLMVTTSKGVTEEHTWTSTTSFAPTAVRELRTTRTGHATWRTGAALSPVLAVSVSFTPTTATKAACAAGSETIYTGQVSGSVSLVTGLRGVKVGVRFSGQPAGELTVDKACAGRPGSPGTPGSAGTPGSPARPGVPGRGSLCVGGSWFISGASQVVGIQPPGTKPSWFDDFGQSGLRTASKRLSRSAAVLVTGSAPRLNRAAKTISVGGLSSGAVTGAAVMSYRMSSAEPPQTCSLGGKIYKETEIAYFSSRVRITRPFQAHSLLAGTLTLRSASAGAYTAVRLTAA